VITRLLSLGRSCRSSARLGLGSGFEHKTSGLLHKFGIQWTRCNFGDGALGLFPMKKTSYETLQYQLDRGIARKRQQRKEEVGGAWSTELGGKLHRTASGWNSQCPATATDKRQGDGYL
jgi:hypothetical protein